MQQTCCMPQHSLALPPNDKGTKCMKQEFTKQMSKFLVLLKFQRWSHFFPEQRGTKCASDAFLPHPCQRLRRPGPHSCWLPSSYRSFQASSWAQRVSWAPKEIPSWIWCTNGACPPPEYHPGWSHGHPLFLPRCDFWEHCGELVVGLIQEKDSVYTELWDLAEHRNNHLNL